MIRAIVFDFDGVILESADVKTDAFRQLFAEGHPDKVDEIVAYHLANEGLSRYEKFEHIHSDILDGLPLSNERSRELGRRFSEIALDRILAAPFVAGALEFIDAHRSRYLLFLASATPEPELLDILRARGILDLFVEAHGAPKKKADVLQDVMSRHGLVPGEVVVVGDAASDRDAAREAGAAFVAREKAEMAGGLGGDATIADLTGLERAIADLEERSPVGCATERRTELRTGRRTGQVEEGGDAR